MHGHGHGVAAWMHWVTTWVRRVAAWVHIIAAWMHRVAAWPVRVAHLCEEVDELHPARFLHCAPPAVCREELVPDVLRRGLDEGAVR